MTKVKHDMSFTQNEEATITVIPLNMHYEHSKVIIPDHHNYFLKSKLLLSVGIHKKRQHPCPVIPTTDYYFGQVSDLFLQYYSCSVLYLRYNTTGGGFR